ncbi:MAG: hypothetical protein QNJ19_01865 [Woeseiaceae bacterium]|nr:hypothetical protein [Woeseiaceae bacterium]
MSSWLRLCAVLLVVCLPSAGVASQDLSPRISVSIAVFDPAIPEDPSVYRDLEIFPRIREVEAMLWPFQLRQSLIDTNAFRMVRVVPEPDNNAELSVVASILQSDGFTLRLHVVATDAMGGTWRDHVYEATIDKETRVGADFQAVFDRIAEDLSSGAIRLEVADVDKLAEVSVLRYAQDVAPRAFGDFLSKNDDGTISILRLPARDDPMVERARMVRETEFVINDVVDEGFVELYAEISKVHDLWREYRRQNQIYQAENARRAGDKDDGYDRASFEHLKRLYDVYKWDRTTVQEQDRLAVAFTNEVGPRVEALEARIAELEVWIDSKYAEWNRLLEALFEVEMRPEPDGQGAL